MATQDLLDTLREYEQKHNEFTRKEMERAKQVQDDLSKTLFRHMQDIGKKRRKNPINYSRMEYKGSAYEHIRVGDAEFDVAMVIEAGVAPVVKSSEPGYYKLGLSGFMAFYSRNRNKFLQRFQGDLHKAVNKYIKENPEWEGRLKLRVHGPAIQIDVYEPNKVKVWYTFDNTPSLIVTPQGGDEEWKFVARKSKNFSEGICDQLWLKSYSFQEKDQFTGIDSDGGCRKQTLRIMKALYHDMSHLKAISTYVLKTVLLNRNKELGQHSQHWMQENLAIRVLDIISVLTDSLKNKKLPHHFDPSINVLEGLGKKTAKLTADAFKQLGQPQKLCTTVKKIIQET